MPLQVERNIEGGKGVRIISTQPVSVVDHSLMVAVLTVHRNELVQTPEHSYNSCMCH